jgi:hypothetical protein
LRAGIEADGAVDAKAAVESRAAIACARRVSAVCPDFQRVQVGIQHGSPAARTNSNSKLLNAH